MFNLDAQVAGRIRLDHIDTRCAILVVTAILVMRIMDSRLSKSKMRFLSKSDITQPYIEA